MSKDDRLSDKKRFAAQHRARVKGREIDLDDHRMPSKVKAVLRQAKRIEERSRKAARI